jgi:hypothetical protein
MKLMTASQMIFVWILFFMINYQPDGKQEERAKGA